MYEKQIVAETIVSATTLSYFQVKKSHIQVKNVTLHNIIKTLHNIVQDISHQRALWSGQVGSGHFRNGFRT